MLLKVIQLLQTPYRTGATCEAAYGGVAYGDSDSKFVANCGFVAYGVFVAYGPPGPVAYGVVVAYDCGVTSAKAYSGTSSCRGTNPGVLNNTTTRNSVTARKGYQKGSLSCFALLFTVAVANVSRMINNREIIKRM